MMKIRQHHRRYGVILLVLMVSLILVQCNQSASAPDGSEIEAEGTPSEVTGLTAPDGATPPPNYEGQTWAEIVAEAQGQTVNWYMWGGSERINGWVNGYVGEQMKARYDVTLNTELIGDTFDAVRKVREEKEAGQNTNGVIDLIWINGENYRIMREENLLYGPWSRFLPNSIFVNWEDLSIVNDFGYPVEGYESPYGKAQIVIVYDQAKMPEPPTTVEQLIAWIKENPGKFTYPALPNFTGSAFVRHVCYWLADDYEVFQGEFDQTVFDEQIPKCYQVLNEIEPYLWQGGETYPKSAAELEELFAKGEVYFEIDYAVSTASQLVEEGKYPATTRTFIFEGGTLANTNYVAIPYNSPNKASAMVLANFLLSPEAQEDKWTGWGSTPVLDPILLSVEWRQKFNNLPRGVATLPLGVLAERRLPEPRSEWVEAIEQGWIDNVFDQ